MEGSKAAANTASFRSNGGLMTWIVITASIIFCMTVGLTARYKENALEEREKALEQYKEYQKDLSALLVELERKDNRIQELEKQFC